MKKKQEEEEKKQDIVEDSTEEEEQEQQDDEDLSEDEAKVSSDNDASDDQDEEQDQLVSVNTLKKGSIVMLKGKPCKVTEKTSSKTGKHGHAKVILSGKDLFTNKNVEVSFQSQNMVPIPKVVKLDLIVAGMDRDLFVDLLDPVTKQKISKACQMDKDDELCDRMLEKLQDEEKILAQTIKYKTKYAIINIRDA